MKFEKKIIIGSVFSFLTTAIGLIAVFYPDLFNLQKEKVEEYSKVIETENDVKDAMGFLNKKINDKKVFKLDLLFCGDMADGYIDILNQIDNLYISSKKENYYNDEYLQKFIEFGLRDDQFSQQFDNIELCKSFSWCTKDDIKLPNTADWIPFYRFPSSMYTNLDDDSPASFKKECKSGYAHTIIHGYAYYKTMQPTQDTVFEIDFEQIPDKDFIKSDY